MYAGYIGGAALLSGLTELQVHVQFLQYYPLPIIIFLAIVLIGALAGGLAFIRALRSKNKRM